MGGSGGGAVCAPGETLACYDGPPDTQGIGACKAGTRTCVADGSGFGDCSGEVLPQPETCASSADDDCDGLVNEEGPDCLCAPGAVESCYSGPPATLGVGACHVGTHTCDATGLAFGPCTGDTVPTAETCAAPGDEDCDGAVNEEGTDCLCTPGSIAACYSADPTTLGVGICTAGTQTCNADGLGHGACTGEVVPSQETCNTPMDDDCDGGVNEDGPGCVCVPNSATSCYTGPAGTLGVGTCASGTSTCNAQGTALGPCVGQVLPAVDSCNTPEDENCDGTNATCNGTYWSRRGGDSDYQDVRTVAADAAGNVIITGLLKGTADFGGGPLTSAGDYDVFVAKFDPNGNLLFSKRFGDAVSQQGLGVTTDLAGNIYLVGGFNGTINFGGQPLVSAGSSDIYLAKLDPMGAHLRSVRFGGPGLDTAEWVEVDSLGNIVIVGTSGTTVDFGGGPLVSTKASLVVARFDSLGNHLASKRFGTMYSTYAGGSALEPNGDVIVVGRFQGTIDFGGGPMTSATLGYDGFVARLTGSLTQVWARRVGTTGDQYVNGVATDAAGNVDLVGQCYNPVDIGGGPVPCSNGGLFAGQLDAAGNAKWTHVYGGDSFWNRLTTNSAGDVILAGAFQETIDFGTGPFTSSPLADCFIAKLDSAGAPLVAQVYGSAANSQTILGVAVDGSDNIVVGGGFADTIDFGSGVLTSSTGNNDAFVAKLPP